jgi:hypothetical protein
LDVDAVGEVVLVAGNGLVEGLAVGEAAEVERLAPAVLVQVGGEVVVLPGQGSVLGLTSLWRFSVSLWRCRDAGAGRTYGALLRSFVLGRLTVKVLEVLVDGGLLGIVALGEHGGHATAGLGRLSVEGLVELGITSLVLALQLGSG